MTTAPLKKLDWSALRFIFLLLTSALAVGGVDQNNATNIPTKAPNSTTNGTTVVAELDDTLSDEQLSTLPLSDVNFLFLTDVHGWVNHRRRGHKQNIDFGDVLSFRDQLNQQMEFDQDLWFVLNGNFIHGGGVLGTQDPPRAMGGILEDMSFDLVTLGKHEVQSSNTIEFLQEPGGIGDWWGSKLLTSNMIDNSTGRSFSENYQYLHGKAATILAFGFIADPVEGELISDMIQIQKVDNVVESKWFKEVLVRKDFDMVVVLATMPANDPLVHIIQKKIRAICGDDIVIQFFAGQSHQRANIELDAKAVSTQAGANLDTLGFVSIDMMKGVSQHAFIETNNASFANSLVGNSKSNYMTTKGLELRYFLERSQEHAGGNVILGCSPRHYRADGFLNETDSLLRLYLKSVMPKGLLKSYVGGDGERNSNNVLLQRINNFVWYDLLPGVITVNDLFAVVPHDDTIVKIAHALQGDKMNRLKGALAGKVTTLNGTTSAFGFATDGAVEHNVGYELFVFSRDAPPIRERLETMRIRHPVDELVDDGQTTLRNVWIDFIRKQWPYDGNNCTTPVQEGEEGEEEEEADDENEDEPIEKMKAEKQSFKDVEKQPNNSAVGAMIGLSFGIAAILLVVAQLSGRHPRGSTGIRDGVELQTMAPKSYRDDPNSYQGPPASAFSNNSLVV